MFSSVVFLIAEVEREMKGKRVIAGILLVGIIAVTLTGCKHTDSSKKETEKPVITLGSDNYPPYNYLNEDGVPTGIDVELAAEAFKRMGYQVDVVQINWEKKKELVERLTVLWDVFPWKDALTITVGRDRTSQVARWLL